MGGDYIEGM